MLAALLMWVAPALSKYKARPWNPRPAESYPARMTSEGVTIAAEPLYDDALAAKVFDKGDIVTRGIMPMAVIIFNENDFDVLVDGHTVELMREGDSQRTLEPGETVQRIFGKASRSVWIPQPIPRIPGGGTPGTEALHDFGEKFLGQKTVRARGHAGGFLYFRAWGNLPESLESSLLYIPHIYRRDTGEKMIFFEIEIRPAVAGGSSR